VSVINEPAHKIVATIAPGKRPRGAAVSPDGALVYVALSGWPIAGPGVDEDKLPPPDKSADGIGVIDAASLKLLRTIHGVANPEQIAISPDGKTLYVPNENANSVQIVGTDGALHGSLPVGAGPEGVAVSPDGKLLYVSSEDDGKITVIDTAAGKPIKTIAVGDRPRGIAFSHDGAHAYVSNEQGSQLVTLDTATGSVTAKLAIPGDNAKPMGVAVSPDDSLVFVSTGRGGMLIKAGAGGGVQKSVAVGKRPWGIATDPAGNLVYTANGTSDDVSVVDAKSMALLARIKTDGRPWGVKSGPMPGGCKS
jgi:YVTN family beta-propeller protein